MSEPRIRYLGDGSEAHFGIPARDLAPDEYDALDTEQRALVRASPLYDYATYRDAVSTTKDMPAEISAPKKATQA